ncbi:hypothetical protein DYY65_08120 [Nitrososphaera sp. AFS]|nr:hypothetical protein [Nitrososphaera sp. AFS]
MSRKTCYKWNDRYSSDVISGLLDLSKASHTRRYN